jgi:hypothetical protein
VLSKARRATICFELPEPLYKGLEKIAYIKGTSIELVTLNAIGVYMSIAKDIDDHYHFKFERVVEETRRLIEIAASKGLVKAGSVKAEKVASSLGRLITLLKDAYGDIPREIVVEDLVKPGEFEKLSKALRKIVGRSSVGGRELNPIAYIVNRIKEVEGVARAFGIDIVKEGGSIKAIRFNNTNLLSMYFGYNTRFLKRRVRG